MTLTQSPSQPMTPLNETNARQLQGDEIRHLTHHLRGTQHALVRLLGEDRGLEDELIALLLSLEISADIERIAKIAPHPRRRFSFQFKGSKVTITVAPEQPLLG